MHPIRFSQTIKVREPQSTILCLHSACDLSHTELKRAMTCGAVWLLRDGKKTRRLRKASYQLKPGDSVAIHYDKALLRKSVENPVNLVRRQNYSVWYKPPGMVTQGTRYGDHLSLLRISEQSMQLHNRLHLIHRLDREARGLVVIAHDKPSSAYLSRQFQKRTVIKKYWAQVEGKLYPAGESFLIEQRLDNKEAATRVIKGPYSKDGDFTDLLIELKTGRYHQIRRHLADLGYPLVGDKRYNKGGKRISKELQLCAYQLCLEEPGSRKTRTFTLPTQLLPPSLQQSLSPSRL